ncbi:hypothetical protein [Lacimicrobium sp. SS2-24]|uniref:hypothetical protein n=1 Tax=Lacimicrobium sp. SS2-24 TaxID=2005569 RepID=UPI00143B0AD4|nr:hypothetical protein [Lacimicrobium sp. SS2-24]
MLETLTKRVLGNRTILFLTTFLGINLICLLMVIDHLLFGFFAEYADDGFIVIFIVALLVFFILNASVGSDETDSARRWYDSQSKKKKKVLKTLVAGWAVSSVLVFLPLSALVIVQ